MAAAVLLVVILLVVIVLVVILVVIVERRASSAFARGVEAVEQRARLIIAPPARKWPPSQAIRCFLAVSARADLAFRRNLMLGEVQVYQASRFQSRLRCPMRRFANFRIATLARFGI